jgi:MFS family permease
MRIAERFGYQRTILAAQIIQTVGMIISPFMPNFYLFLFFYLFLPGLSFGLCAFPTMGCVWSHFRQNQGRITGILLGFFSFMSLGYMVVLTFMINPHNQGASEIVFHSIFIALGLRRKIIISLFQLRRGIECQEIVDNNFSLCQLGWLTRSTLHFSPATQ